MKGNSSPITGIYTPLLRALAAVYGVLVVFWSSILLQTALFRSSTIGISGVQYFRQADVGMALMLLCAGGLVGSLVLLLLAAIKRYPTQALCWTTGGLLVAGSLMLLCIPPQMYVTALYIVFRKWAFLPGWVFSPFLPAGVAGGCAVCLLLRAGQKTKNAG